MNRQALAFLTMFSLVLMLSVYYVTLPSDTETVMKDTQVSSVVQDKQQQDKENTSETSTKESEQEQLQESIEEKKQNEINQQSAIVADEQAQEEQKQEALASLEVLKEQSNLQDTIVKTLEEQDIKSAVEIQEHTCMVSVFEQEESKELAKKVMDIVTAITGQSYLVEITFK